MRWSLRKKIVLGYGLVLALLMLLLGWSLRSLSALGSASAAILRENYRSILAAEAMINAIERQDSAVLLWLLGERRRGEEMARGEQMEFLQWLGRARDNITIEGERVVIDSVETGYRDYLAEVAALEQAALPPEAALQRYLTVVMPAFVAVREECIGLRDLNQEVMFRASERAGALARRSIWSQSLAGAGGLAVGLVLSLLLATWLTRPLRDLLGGVQRIAAGDYEVVLPVASRDELGRLTDEFNTMARELGRFRDLNVDTIVAEQEKSAAILRSIDDGLVVVDPELRITNLNPAGAVLLGVDRHEARGRHLLEVVPDERVVDRVRGALRPDDGPASSDELILTIGHDGHDPRHCQVAVNRFATPGGEPGVVVLLRDVTRLTELDRLKTQFVMTASHELRTPLTSIGMAVALVRERSAGTLSERERELLKAADEDVHRLRALIDDLLDLARLESGQVTMDLVDTPLGPLIESAVGVLAPQFDEHGVRLSVAESDPSPTVVADANKITWVVTNLLANALRFTPAGGQVSVDYRPVGDQARISVRDTGVGIAAEDQSRIFDKFVQVGAPAGGTGLGLSICREIVRAHGGIIWVESQLGEGSTFHVCLPLARGG